MNTGAGTQGRSSRMSILEISERLSVGEMAVYEMLQHGKIPGIRIGRGKGRWLVTRAAFEVWERSCGLPIQLQSEQETRQGVQ